MRIAVVFDDGLDKPDGVQQCIITLNQWLTTQGHEVHYIVGHTTRSDIPNVHVAARNMPVRFNGNRLTIPLPTSQQKLDNLLDHIKPDVMHVHTPYSPFMGAKAIQAAPQTTGIVGTFHVLPYGFMARYGTRLLGIWLRPSLKRITALYAGTPAAADFASWSMQMPVGVMPHAVNVRQFQHTKKLKAKGSKLRIVFLGRLVQRKGALNLVRAIAALPDNVTAQIDVRIGGRGEQLAPIERLIAAHNLANFVHMDGFISEADKPAYLAAADIAIFPSISGESFGISLIEPMAAGAGIVVGGNNLGYEAILGAWPETLFDPKDTAALTTFLIGLITDKPLRDRIHYLQQQAVNQYDVERIGQRWLEIYAQAISDAAAFDMQ
ncbi:glycosyltransferase [Aeromicrobium sp.]|nr:glycosyltransferase [Candidatus Saccharibacteria bacterium]